MSSAVEEMAQPTVQLELVSDTEISLEASRHLFLAADLLDPARRKEINLPGGGEEVPNRCMWRTSGLLPRCEITPVERWGDPQPLELFPAGVRPLKLKGQEVVNQGVGNPQILTGKPLFFIPTYPGELIVDALGIASGERRGIVEIECLRDVNYGNYDRELQALYFPADFVKPRQLRLVQQHIDKVMNSVADADARSCGENMLLSCEQSREYMGDVVSKMQTQLRERVSFQYVHRLTPKVRSFMEQLEIKPPVDGASLLQEQVVQAAVSTGISPEMLDAIMAKQGEAMAATMATAMANAIREAMATQQPPATPAES